MFGEERFNRFIASFDEVQPVSVRFNPFKPTPSPSDAKQIPWCSNAYWLDARPDFTIDPLLHAGCYYVQEAGSMFLDEILRQHVTQPVTMLDLCAAPGGKSTLARAALPEGSVLYANEPDHRRANILMENLQKQGLPDVIVTNNYAKDYQKAKMLFDIILTDVPCSGEGMFRKDAGAIDEWNISNVLKCRDLQRSIITDIWPCLRNGGLLIYSTCTFNTRENEENVRWISEELGAETLSVDINSDWGITGTLLDGFNKPVYRFIPGITKTEGLFVCVMRKTSDDCSGSRNARQNPKTLRVLSDGNPQPTIKGKDKIPAHAEALLANLPKEKYPKAEVNHETALQYLRREAIVLPDSTPKGYVIITYQGHNLGFVKNLGNRANNLYPQEWRIRNK